MQAKRVYRLIEGRCGVLVLDDATTTNLPPSSDGGASPQGTVPSSTSDENPVAQQQSSSETEGTPKTDKVRSCNSLKFRCVHTDIKFKHETLIDNRCTERRYLARRKTADELEQLGQAISDGTTELLSESAPAARDLEYRRERDEQRRLDDERRQEREALREERHQQHEERFLALVAEIVRKRD
ncbi:unnamed protein product [Phytophthora fragariaefolia]|uniref:Unnamed protein product n=1 Tax=Phytophthora fragariaefolia TaxID=1490495 RepID=A0A9W6X180_9STRA|nr:unnamed protein product [Phytophthora fragariaefolia]